MANHKKYTVSYTSGATGYGWEEDFDRLEEFEYFVDSMRSQYTAFVTVYDSSLKDFIFWKDCLEYKPSIDLLHRFDRDMRTTTRLRKGGVTNDQ